MARQTKGTRWRWGALIGAVTLVAAAMVAVPAVAGNGARHADATIRDGSGQVIGFAQLTEDGRGTVHVNVHVDGLTPGLHGIHFHQVGSCVGPAFASAGSHHNPTNAMHGTESTAANHPHAGDLPNLIVNENGVGHLDAKTTFATLSDGPLSVFDANGSAIVIHAGTDDLMTDPTGNSGARIACGVIES